MQKTLNLEVAYNSRRPHKVPLQSTKNKILKPLWAIIDDKKKSSAVQSVPVITSESMDERNVVM